MKGKNMITAKEAKERTELMKQQKTQKLITRIERAIEREVSKGESFVTVELDDIYTNENVPEEVITYLIELGYGVVNNRYEDFIEVHW